jgi:hypothetical protein
VTGSGYRPAVAPSTGVTLGDRCVGAEVSGDR